VPSPWCQGLVKACEPDQPDLTNRQVWWRHMQRWRVTVEAPAVKCAEKPPELWRIAMTNARRMACKPPRSHLFGHPLPCKSPGAAAAKPSLPSTSVPIPPPASGLLQVGSPSKMFSKPPRDRQFTGGGHGGVSWKASASLHTRHRLPCCRLPVRPPYGAGGAHGRPADANPTHCA
jgi:hypothetical protein